MTVSLGSQSAKTEQRTEIHSADASTLSAGRDIRISATAAETAASNSGDLRLRGAQLKAVRDTELDAAGAVSLLSAENSQRITGHNESRGGSVGVSVGGGQGGFSVSVQASINHGRGEEAGSSLTHSLSTIDSGRGLAVSAGGDTTLKGAQLSAEHIRLNSGGGLTLASERDSDHYHSKQQNFSAGVSIPVYGYGTASVSLSASRDRIHSTFDSVTKQTGIYAGSGGYQIQTGGHTQLDGAVIASTADNSKNHLDTGTLGFSHLHNQADFTSEHQGISFSSGSPVSGIISSAAAVTGAGSHSGHSQSVSYAAVSDGAISIRDPAGQRQDIGELSRDTAHAANGLSPIFNKEKEQKRLQAIQSVTDIGGQISDIAASEGKIRATRQAKQAVKNATAADRSRARSALIREANQSARNSRRPARPVTEAAISDYIYQTSYQQALRDSGFGTGGKYQQAITALTGAAQGLVAGSPGAAVAGASAPYLATGIKRLTTTDGKVSQPANLLAHVAVNSGLALVSGHHSAGVIATAAGTATGEAVALMATQALNKTPEQLTEDERRGVAALATVTAGLAGGITGNSAASAALAAQAGKTTVENNFLVPVPVPVVLPPPVAWQNANPEQTEYQQKALAIAIGHYLKGFEERLAGLLTPEAKSEAIRNALQQLTPEQKQQINTEWEQIRLALNPPPLDVKKYLTTDSLGKLISRNGRPLVQNRDGTVFWQMTGGAGNYIFIRDYITLNDYGIQVYSKEGTFLHALNTDGTFNKTLSEIYDGNRIDPAALRPQADSALVIKDNPDSSIHVLNQNNSSQGDSKPNIGKNLSTQDKAEFGGSDSGTPDGWEPQDEENARNKRHKITTVEDLLSTSTREPKTRGRSIIYSRTGGINTANKEFDALSPDNIKDISSGRVGKLSDGRTVVVRARSKDGRPTLEIQNRNGSIKFRYED